MLENLASLRRFAMPRMMVVNEERKAWRFRCFSSVAAISSATAGS